MKLQHSIEIEPGTAEGCDRIIDGISSAAMGESSADLLMAIVAISAQILNKAGHTETEVDRFFSAIKTYMKLYKLTPPYTQQ